MSNDWSLEVAITAKRGGEATSRTSHEVFDLDNQTTDTAVEQLVMKLIEQVHEWQDYKRTGKSG